MFLLLKKKKKALILFLGFFVQHQTWLKFCSSRNSSTLSSHIVVTEHVQGCDSFEYICLQFVLEYFCSQTCWDNCSLKLLCCSPFDGKLFPGIYSKGRADVYPQSVLLWDLKDKNFSLFEKNVFVLLLSGFFWLFCFKTEWLLTRNWLTTDHKEISISCFREFFFFPCKYSNQASSFSQIYRS